MVVMVQYFPHRQRRLMEEYERCQQYLDPATRAPLIAAVEARLLQGHLAALLDKGFEGLVAGARLPDLARLYRSAALLHRI